MHISKTNHLKTTGKMYKQILNNHKIVQQHDLALSVNVQ